MPKMWRKNVMPIAPRNTANFDGLAEVAMHGPQGSRGSSDAIRRQEADGQCSFVNSDTLPTDMGRDGRKVLEQAGVVFGDEVSGDEIFTYVTLPAGWERVATGHDMWSDLVDNRGRKRASVFYKAAFYDRHAHLRVSRRFDAGEDCEYEDKDNAIRYLVTDGGVVVFTTQAHSFAGEQYDADWHQKDKLANKEALSWLRENFPEWEDAGAYWD